MNDIPPHFMRYGIHAEKKYFLSDFRDCYDGVALNGNLVAYTLGATSSFLTALIADKPYFIDPITHAFGHHPRAISKITESGTLEIKAAIKSLGGHYGPVITNVLESIRQLRPDDFENEGMKRDFTNSVLTFQKNIIRKGLEESGESKYIEAEAGEPCFLIAPYFYLSEGEPELWLQNNIEFARIAKEQEDNLPIYAELLVAKNTFIDTDEREKILRNYVELPVDGVLLWIEGFSEHDASEKALKRYKAFVDSLKNSNKKILIMYGGYFSTILTQSGDVSVCHGPGYGEEREVTPVGGGLPLPKYYYPKLHTRLPFREVALAIEKMGIRTQDAYFEKVCSCQMCRNLLEGDYGKFIEFGESKIGIRRDGVAFEYATGWAKEISTAHYIYKKKEEFEFVSSSTLEDIISDLSESYDECKGTFDKSDSGHLNLWNKALK